MAWNPYHRTNKYNNKKTEYNGELYSSKREAEKAMELDIMKKSGEVKSWTPHPKYLLIKRFIKNGKIYRPTHYIADFYVEYYDGRIEVIDIKGFRTEGFNIKCKLFNSLYPDLKLVLEK